MLEIRKNTFSKSYENTFFREFSKDLHNLFEEKNWEGILIGSPECTVENRLQIDALLITKHVVFIIDFKNYGGRIELPNSYNFQDGLWKNHSGEIIKGGSSINPYRQLKNQKTRFCKVFEEHIKAQLLESDYFESSHTIRVVCFHEEVELSQQVPSREELNFAILDKKDFLSGLLDRIDVTDKEVNISKGSFDAFKKIFRADLYEFEEKSEFEKGVEFENYSERLNYNDLKPDQNTALSGIQEFLRNDDLDVFVLHGTTNSGKSHLIPFIQDIAYKEGLEEVEIFASSRRVANNLMNLNGVDQANSLYSYIYGGQLIEGEVSNQEILNIDSEDNKIPIDKIPLKNSDNSDDALFIVDESQLVSDAYHQSIDLIFGSGHLLRDFIKFTSSVKNKRKIIFIGDSYQLNYGKSDESPLNTTYLEESYGLNTAAFQLYDKPEQSEVTKQALKCVDGIRNNYFSLLRLDINESILSLSNDEIKGAINDMVQNRTGHILCFSNEDTQKVNLWIKRIILKNSEDLAAKDLVLVNNNIQIETPDDPFALPQRVYNGQFATVKSVKNEIEEINIRVKNETEVTLKFRELVIKIDETKSEAKVLSFENYRLSKKGEISENEAIALKIYLNHEVSKKLKQEPFNESAEYKDFLKSESYLKLENEINDLKRRLNTGERVKTQLDAKETEQRVLIRKEKSNYRKKIIRNLKRDSSSNYYKVRNAVYLRFGWAMTVHKSMSYKFENIVFDVDPGERIGKTNQAHFKWLYTGLSRARSKVSLINYNPITPFDNTELVDSNNNQNPTDYFLISDSPNRDIQLKELEKLINNIIQNTGINIDNIEHLNWQERYHFKEGSKTSVISISYNGQGRFRYPTHTGGETKLSERIINVFKEGVQFDFELIDDKWRRKQYEQIAFFLEKDGIEFRQAIQTPYKDKIKLCSENGELAIEVDYNGQGAFSLITAKYYSDEMLWESFQEAINLIQE
jgi:hypothetical protein